MKQFYVYEYYIVDTGEVFYVGKGTKRRYKELHNRTKYFLAIYNKYSCSVRITHTHLTNVEACELEKLRIAELRELGMARANLTSGGEGFSSGILNPTHRVSHKGMLNSFYGKRHTDETKRRISEAKKGSTGLSGERNPMYGSTRFIGERNPMFGRTGLKHHNSVCYRVTYIDGTTELLHRVACEKKFGIAFIRVANAGGILTYKKKTPNRIYEGVLIELID